MEENVELEVAGNEPQAQVSETKSLFQEAMDKFNPSNNESNKEAEKAEVVKSEVNDGFDLNEEVEAVEASAGSDIDLSEYFGKEVKGQEAIKRIAQEYKELEAKSLEAEAKYKELEERNNQRSYKTDILAEADYAVTNGILNNVEEYFNLKKLVENKYASSTDDQVLENDFKNFFIMNKYNGVGITDEIEAECLELAYSAIDDMSDNQRMIRAMEVRQKWVAEDAALMSKITGRKIEQVDTAVILNNQLSKIDDAYNVLKQKNVHGFKVPEKVVNELKTSWESGKFLADLFDADEHGNPNMEVVIAMQMFKKYGAKMFDKVKEMGNKKAHNAVQETRLSEFEKISNFNPNTASNPMNENGGQGGGLSMLEHKLAEFRKLNK